VRCQYDTKGDIVQSHVEADSQPPNKRYIQCRNYIRRVLKGEESHTESTAQTHDIKHAGEKWSYSHPGVEAFGYVKMTTPDLLSSTSLFSVVLSPSLVSTSLPKPSSVIVSPTVILPDFGG
jgi:hypothetical protein